MIHNFLHDEGVELLALPGDIARALDDLVNLLIVFAGDKASGRRASLLREMRDAIERTIPYGAAIPWDVPFMGPWLVRLASWLRETAAVRVSAPRSGVRGGLSPLVRAAHGPSSGRTGPHQATTTWRRRSCWYATREYS